jgi:outer membrane protein with beta-barrel domain
MKGSTMSVLALSVLCVSSLRAQAKPEIRRGATFSVGVGSGSTRLSCTACNPDRQSAPSLYVRLAGTYRPNLVIGAEIDAWSKRVPDTDPSGDVRFTVATLDAVALWYPQCSAGFFLSGGLGYGTINDSFEVGTRGSVSDRTTAIGFQVGAGYDLRMGRTFALTPYAKYFGTAGGKVEGTGAQLDANVAEIGLGFTWH